MITCIYKISNIVNSRVYIGSAVNFSLRRNRHLTSLRKNKHCNAKLQRFVNKYGIDKLVFSILEECDKEMLLKREQFFIDKYQSANTKGFNILPTAGSWLNKKHKASSIKKQSLAKIGKATTTGNKHSDETKRKISQKAIGRTQSKETIEKRVNKNRGKKRPESANQIVREKLRKLSDNQILEIKSLLSFGVRQLDIAKIFGVCQRNISRINQGLSYFDIIPTDEFLKEAEKRFLSTKPATLFDVA